jgi:hypothetical protein
MFKAALLYIIALYLVGYSVRWMMEESYSSGFNKGDRRGYDRWLSGYNTGYAAKARHEFDTVVEDVHRES